MKPKWGNQGKGYDIETKTRFIEVKGRDRFRIPSSVGFSHNFLKLGRSVNKFWIYVVLGVKVKNKKKEIIKIPPQEILRGLQPVVRYVIPNKIIRKMAEKQGIKIKGKSLVEKV